MQMFVDILKSNRTFSDFLDEELLLIVNLCEQVKYLKDQIIFEENQQDDGSVYFIQEGSVKITKAGKTKEKVIAIFGMGNVFGEMSFLDKFPRSATVTSLEHTVVLKLSPEKMQELINQSSRTALKLLSMFIKKLTMRLRQTNEALVGQEDKIIIT